MIEERVSMKIISSKKWENINQNVVDLQCDLRKSQDDNATYFAQVEALRKKLSDERNSLTNINDSNISLVQANTLLEKEIKEKNIEIKKLKTLLTKNKIDYKFLYAENVTEKKITKKIRSRKSNSKANTTK